jgi:GTPase
MKAIRRSDVVLFLLDATQSISDQDRILSERIATEGRACIIVVNKWDILPNKNEKSYLEVTNNVRVMLPALKYAKVIMVSASQGQRTDKLYDLIYQAKQTFMTRISTAVLNEIVQDAILYTPPPLVQNRHGRIYYTIQASTAPPTFVFFVNDPDLFTDNYQRYLEKKLRQNFPLEGAPLKLIFRGKSLRQVSRSAKRGEIGQIAAKVLGSESSSSSSSSSVMDESKIRKNRSKKGEQSQKKSSITSSSSISSPFAPVKVK